MDVKVVDGNKTRVIERGRVAEGMDASKAATQNIASVEDSTLKVSQFGSDDGKAIDRSVTVELPRRVAEHLKGVNAHVGSGDLQIAGVICDGFDLFLGAGDVEFTGSVTDFLPLGYDGETILNLEFDNGDKSATYRFEVGSGDMSFDPE